MEVGFDSLSVTEMSPEPIVKQGGSAAISDDEIEVLSSEPTADKKETVKKELKAKSKEPGSESGSDTAKKDIKDAGKDNAEGQQVSLKTLKIKNGDTDLDLREDAIVPVKIDGKVTQVPIKDLLAEFSGKTDWTRKYQDLHNDKTKFYTERDTITGRINDFYRLSVEEKNPRMAIELLAESMGADPQEVWQNLMAPIKEAMKNAPQLSPEELAANETKEELEYYRRRDALRKADTEKARENESLISRIKETQAKHSMNPEQFKQCYDDMVQEAKRSGFDEKNLTPEMVGEYFQIVDRRSKVQGFVLETYKDSDKQTEIEAQLYETWQKNPEFSLDDLKDIASEVFGSPKAKAARLVERVKETKTKEKVLPQNEPLSWDDL